MIDLLLPCNENVILSAYAAITESSQVEPEALVAEYKRLFVSAVQPVQGRTSVFERFSLVDPNLRTIIQSSTVPA